MSWGEDKIDSAWCSANDKARANCRLGERCRDCVHWKMPNMIEFEDVLKNTIPKDVVVKVVDEGLLRDGRFDRGVTYVMEEREPRHPDFIWVYDKNGVKDCYLRRGFLVCFEEGVKA